MKKLLTLCLLATFMIAPAQNKKGKITGSRTVTVEEKHSQNEDSGSAALPVESLISKYIDALGGATKLREAKSVVAEAVFYTQGMKIPTKMWFLHKEGMRMDMEIQRRTNTTVITPYGGWTLFPAQRQKRPVDADEATAREGAEELDLGGDLLDYRSKGHIVELLGTEDLDGHEVYKLKVTRKSGTEVLYFLDAGTYLMRKKTQDKTLEGKVTNITEHYRDYTKTPDGYVYAASCEYAPSGISIKFVKYEVNVPVDPKLFAKP